MTQPHPGLFSAVYDSQRVGRRSGNNGPTTCVLGHGEKTLVLNHGKNAPTLMMQGGFLSYASEPGRWTVHFHQGVQPSAASVHADKAYFSSDEYWAATLFASYRAVARNHRPVACVPGKGASGGTHKLETCTRSRHRWQVNGSPASPLTKLVAPRGQKRLEARVRMEYVRVDSAGRKKWSSFRVSIVWEDHRDPTVLVIAELKPGPNTRSALRSVFCFKSVSEFFRLPGDRPRTPIAW